MHVETNTDRRGARHGALLGSLLKHRGVAALLGLAALGSLALNGCYGRFPITRSLYRWNGDIGTDKYIKSILFWPLVPVYGVCIIVDALIINLIEFWSGDRIVKETRIMQPDGTELALLPGAKADEAVIQLGRDGRTLHTLRFERVSNHELRVWNEQGTQVGSAWRTDGGRIELRDATGATVAVTSEREFPKAALALSAL